jgi:hypothetical protein
MSTRATPSRWIRIWTITEDDRVGYRELHSRRSWWRITAVSSFGLPPDQELADCDDLHGRGQARHALPYPTDLAYIAGGVIILYNTEMDRLRKRSLEIPEI